MTTLALQELSIHLYNLLLDEVKSDSIKFLLLIINSPEKYWSALPPIEETFFPIVTLLNKSHLPNAKAPIVRTESGTTKLVRLVHRKNAYSPISVTLLPIVAFVKFEQLSYLQPVITQYFASNKSEIWS